MDRRKPGFFNAEVITHQGVQICVPKQPSNVRRMAAWCKMLSSAKRRAEMGIISSYGFALPTTPPKTSKKSTKREWYRWLYAAKIRFYKPKFVRKPVAHINAVRRRKYGVFIPSGYKAVDPWYATVFSMKARGMRVSQISKKLGMDPSRVRYYLKAATAEMAWLGGRLSKIYRGVRNQLDDMIDGL